MFWFAFSFGFCYAFGSIKFHLGALLCGWLEIRVEWNCFFNLSSLSWRLGSVWWIRLYRVSLVSFDLVALPCKTLHLLHFNISRDAFQLPFWPSLVLFGVGSQSPTDFLPHASSTFLLSELCLPFLHLQLFYLLFNLENISLDFYLAVP